MTHYSTSGPQQSPSDVTVQPKHDTSDPNTYVDLSSSDPESIQLKSLKVGESIAVSHKAAADSWSSSG